MKNPMGSSKSTTPQPDILGHLEKLVHFVSVAEAGSFSKASRQLRLAQPSLSKSIKVLEKVCGAPLFERRRSGVVPTTAGQTLLVEARSILHRARSIETKLSQTHLQKPLIFETHEILLPLFVDRFKDLHPSIGLHLSTYSSATTMVERVAHFQSDSCVTGLCKPPTSLHVMPLFKDEYCFFATPLLCKDFLIGRDGVSIQRLQTLPLILPGGALLTADRTIEEELEFRGLDLNPKYRVSSIESCIQLVQANYGLGLVPKKVAKPHWKTKTNLIRVQGLAALSGLEFGFCVRTEDWKSSPHLKSLYRNLRTALTT